MVSIKTIHQKRSRDKSCRGMLTTEMIVGMAILVLAVLPIGYSLVNDARALRMTYQHAVAMEIVDGEMEILAAGQWRSFPEGTNAYTVHAASATNLPPGKFQLIRAGNHIQLEWRCNPPRAAKIVREVTVR
jgi:hypothetical protein